MYDCYLDASAQLIQIGKKEADIPLSHNLEAYLAHTLARFFTAPIDPDLFTIRLRDAFGPPRRQEAFRSLADECLVASALFPERVTRTGSLEYYTGIGRTAYKEASLVEQAYSFPHMRDVVMAGASRVSKSVGDLIALARADSTLAARILRTENIIVGPWT